MDVSAVPGCVRPGWRSAEREKPRYFSYLGLLGSWLPNLAGVRTDADIVPVMDVAVTVPELEERVVPAAGERARRWQRWLAKGVFASRAELARAEGVSRAAVTQALRRLERLRQVRHSRLDPAQDDETLSVEG